MKQEAFPALLNRHIKGQKTVKQDEFLNSKHIKGKLVGVEIHKQSYFWEMLCCHNMKL